MDDHLLETDVSQLQVSLCQVPFIESSAIVCFCAKGSSFLMSHAEERNTLLLVSVNACKSRFDVQSDVECNEHQPDM